jgi:hypothetical protein
VPRLRALADEPTNLWNQFVAAIGEDRIVAGLANQDTAGGAASLLAACRNGHLGLVAALSPDTPMGMRFGGFRAGRSMRNPLWCRRIEVLTL